MDEAFVIQEQNIALNFIGSRGARPGNYSMIHLAAVGIFLCLYLAYSACFSLSGKDNTLFSLFLNDWIESDQLMRLKRVLVAAAIVS